MEVVSSDHNLTAAICIHKALLFGFKTDTTYSVGIFLENSGFTGIDTTPRTLDDGPAGVFEKKYEKILIRGVFAGQAVVEKGRA